VTVKRIEATHLHKVQAKLGEGPIWDARNSVLWFVDIVSQMVHRLNPQTGDRSSWLAPSKVGWVAPAAGGDLISGLARGLYRFSPASGQFTLLYAVESTLPGNRINDGVVDAAGNVWFGTMNDVGPVPCGRFYRFNGRSVEDTGIPPMCITNGPAVSPDGRTLYVVDTLAGQITAYALYKGGVLGEQRAFVKVEPSGGRPDGVTCDADGGVWLGLWGGWAARRYDASGALTDEVRFPAANVTKIALGGRDGRTAYATTAREGLDGDGLAQQPLAGDVFTFRVQTSGITTPEVAVNSSQADSGFMLPDDRPKER
jgi:sugar lactone lactonase YvrE